MKNRILELFQQTPMAFISIGIIIGILSDKLFSFPVHSFVIPISIILLLLLIKQWKYSYLIILLLSMLIGYSLQYNKNIDFYNHLRKLEPVNSEQIEFSGIVQEINNYKSGQRFIVKNVQINTDNYNISNEVKYIVYPKNKIINDINIGDTLSSSGKFELFQEIRNPGEFDFKKYYHIKHIVGKIYSNESIKVLHNRNWLLKKSIDRAREAIRNKLTAYSDTETAALFSALILGDRNQIDEDLRESFANVGVVHVLAVSGLHVGYVLLILMVLVKIIRIQWGWDKLIIILGLVAFSIISGGRPSVVRASIMAGLYISAPLFNRRPNAWNIVATAAFIILLINPNALYDLGFQLSFTAVLSIIYFYNLINKILPEWSRPVNIQYNIIRYAWSLFLISLSAQFGTIPVVALYFGRIPIIAVIANLIVIPLIGVFVALGFTKLIFFWLPPFSFFVDQVSWLIRELIYGSIRLFDKIPFASIATPQFDTIVLLIYLTVIIIVFAVFQRKIGKILIYTTLLINLVIWSNLFRDKTTEIIFLDLGKNECAIVKMGTQSVMINNGVHSMFTNDIDRKILPSLKYLKIDKIDYFIRPVGNSNYKVGSVKLIEKLPIDEIWDCGFDSKSSFDRYFQSLAHLKESRYIYAKRNDIIQLGNKAYIQFLLPLDNSQIENNYAMFIENNDNKLLLFDQLSNNEYGILLNDIELLKPNILKMSYPKVLNDNLKTMVSAINPKMTIITGKQTSKNNPTIEQLREIIPNELLFTDSNGAVWLVPNKNNIEVKNWK